MGRLAVLALVALAGLAVVVTVSLGSSARQSTPLRSKVRATQVRATRLASSASAAWPSARTTGADPRRVTGSVPVSGGFFSSSATDLTIANKEIDGGVYWNGTGTLTLRNDVIKPDWRQAWAAVAAVGRGNVIVDHVTITGVNVGARGQFTKGITMQSSGRLDVAYLNESGICQNDLGSGAATIRDSYLHDIGSGDPTTCHATAIEIQGPTQGPITITHNTIDHFPGKDFQAGSDGAIFVQALNGPISGIVIDNNFLHSAYSDIEIAGDGRYGIAGTVVTNNCLVWPRRGMPLSAPGSAVTRWSGNTKCTFAQKSTGRGVRR